VEPAEGSDGTDGQWQIARKVAEDRVISVNDPDARHTRKSQQARRDGYRAYVAADPETRIITDEKLTRAAGTESSDPAVAEELVASETASRDDRAEDDALAWYGDTAYGTGELRGAIRDAGHQAVIKPKPVQPAVKGGLTRDDFTVDEQAGTVTCPAGVTRAIPPSRHVVFGAACRACPLREQCTTSKSGRVLSLHPLDHLLRAARTAWTADAALREDYARHRPNVERVIAQVATVRGRRLKLRYRGVTKNHAWLKYRTAALNLRNLASHGLGRRDGAWALAT
jgi:Transposase DDE domain